MNINYVFGTDDLYDPLSYASPLYITRASCANYTQYTGPLSYTDWLTLPLGKKAAVLFVQFFEQITLAWSKVKSFYTPEEDAVTTMFQYIMKNIPLIEASEKKFTPAYVYKVAFNCLYCICHDIKRDRDRYELETSNITLTDCGESDLFSTVASGASLQDEIILNDLWGTIDNLPEDYKNYISSILEGSRATGIPAARKAEIKEHLKLLLAPFSDLYEEHEVRIHTFKELWVHRDHINSAVVTLTSGLKVSYYKTEVVRKGTRFFVTFFGPDKDYTFPVSDISDLAVSDVEWAS